MDVDLGRAVASSPDAVVIVDELRPEMAEVLSHIQFRSGFYLTASDAAPPSPWRQLALVPGPDDSGPAPVGPYVALNPMAARHRHHGFGFIDYLLVLSSPQEMDDPPDAVAWLSAALHDADVVAIREGVASAWRGRALRGRAAVESRTDLWRLMAHAAVCIDLRPGRLIALECIEALRFGTPIIVPEDSGPGATHARRAGGATFADASELITATLNLQSASTNASLVAKGKDYADKYFGDAERFEYCLGEILAE